MSAELVIEAPAEIELGEWLALLDLLPGSIYTVYDNDGGRAAIVDLEGYSIFAWSTQHPAPGGVWVDVLVGDGFESLGEQMAEQVAARAGGSVRRWD